ncbi:MAG: hypothetical protein J6U43_05960 [Bacteroidales bacterium]|nr:hypothetical protein [Bacteroidales bacterium]
MNTKYLRPTSAEVEIWGATLLLIPFLSLLVATVSFFLGGGLGWWMFPSAIVASFAIGHTLIARLNGTPSSHFRFYLYTALSLGIALLSAGILYDNSFDGNTYHQGSIIDMIMGCNPIYNAQDFTSLWSRHYAKAIEIAASTITLFFNRIECGKAVNILLIEASIFITYSFLRREFNHHTTRSIAFFTLLLTLCPTVIRQAYIYYIDYTLYTFLLLAVLSLITIYRTHSTLSWLILGTTAIMAATTKFTVGFYIFLAIAVGILWFFMSGRRTLSFRTTVFAIGLFIVGFGVVGYHPYLTNTWGWGNPFYPLLGSDIDIMSGNTPEIYAEGNRFTNWVRSLFYNAQGSGIWIPFANHSLHDYYISHESRIAGFGPLFGYTLFASILLVAYCLHKECITHTLNKRIATTFVGIALLLLMACFIFEQSWWMRYIPFLWAVPVILLLYTELHNTFSRPWRIARNILYTMLVATQLLCCATTIVAGGAFTQRFSGLLQAITPQSTVKVYHLIQSPSFEYKLQEGGVNYEVINSYLEADTTLHRVHIPDNADVYVDSETYSRMQHPDLLDYISGKK